MKRFKSNLLVIGFSIVAISCIGAAGLFWVEIPTTPLSLDVSNLSIDGVHLGDSPSLVSQILGAPVSLSLIHI